MVVVQGQEGMCALLLSPLIHTLEHVVTKASHKGLLVKRITLC
jgi:hypothetical protein